MKKLALKKELQDTIKLLDKCKEFMTENIWQLYVYHKSFVFDFKCLHRLYVLALKNEDINYDELVHAFDKLGKSYEEL